jgi:hypothetical protein
MTQGGSSWLPDSPWSVREAVKRGSNHPFDAIGIVASTVVFVGAAAWQGVSYFALR